MVFQRTMDLPSKLHAIIVEVEAPTESLGDWSCLTRIRDATSVVFSRHIYGSDAIQCIMLALDVLRSELKHVFPDATWNGLVLDLAFPAFIPYVAGLEIYKDVEGYAEQLLKAKFA